MIALLLAVAGCVPVPTCTETLTVNCATPTPVLAWDGVLDELLAGYRLYARKSGTALALVAELPCEWSDLDEDGVFDTRFCRGVDSDIPVQRHCATCAPLELCEFAVTAFDLLGRESIGYSGAVAICMPPICDLAGHGPCN